MSEVNQTVYKRNFITHAVLKVDYPQILGLTKENPPVDVQKFLVEKKYIVEQMTEKKIHLQIIKGKTNFDEKEADQWKFSNNEKKRTLVLNPSYFTFEYNVFEDFDAFLVEFQEIFDKIKQIYCIKILNRIGLRFINQISLDEGEIFSWRGELNNNLTCISKDFLIENEKPLRIMNSVEIKKDDKHILFKYGMWNSEYPNIINRKEFVLDYDCFIEDEIESSRTFELAHDFYLIILDLFERSIDSKLREIMGKESQ